METYVFVLATAGLGVAVIFLYALLKTAYDNDRAARRAEKELLPYSDVTVTGWGETPLEPTAPLPASGTLTAFRTPDET